VLLFNVTQNRHVLVLLSEPSELWFIAGSRQSMTEVVPDKANVVFAQLFEFVGVVLVARR